MIKSTYLIKQVQWFINRYNRDGYGDKPEDMDTYVYWLQQEPPSKSECSLALEEAKKRWK